MDKITKREKSYDMSHNITKIAIFSPVNFDTSRHIAELRICFDT